jgi:hypothetical protein
MQHETKVLLLQRVAQDYDDIAEDLENGAVDIIPRCCRSVIVNATTG